MKKKLVLAALLLGASLTLPVQAQLQYFGYVGGADDDLSLANTKGFTNFAAFSTDTNLADTFLRTRISAMAPYGIKALIDLGNVLWCDYSPDDSLDYVLCDNWQQRWTTWTHNNADVLSPDKVIAFAIRDEPFRWDVDGTQYDAVSQVVKSTFPWVKIYLPESACVLEGYCQSAKGQPEFPTSYSRYHGNLPYVDWIGLNSYAIHPTTNSAYLNDRTVFKSRFPGKKWIYVIDGFWDSSHGDAGIELGEMSQIAHEWYDLARNDPDAVLLGVFLWPHIQGWTTSQDFVCPALAEHVAIGRAVTGKVRAHAAPPIGSFSVNGSGVLSGWACDPDGTICENPQVDLYMDGSYYSAVFDFNYYSPPSGSLVTSQCGAGVAARFSRLLTDTTGGHRITAFARDLDSGGSGLPSTCPENPACIWYLHYSQPKGYMDGITATGYASGWVCDQDAPQISSQVRLATSGGYIGLYTTNLGNEQAVSTQCGGGTLHRFGVQLPAWTKGLPIYAYAEDLGAPYTTGEVQIPWLCPAGWTCTWF
jgi:hypothetical protein